MSQVLLYAFIAGVLGTTLGGIIGVLLKKRRVGVDILYGIAGGVMLAMVLCDLIIEAINKSNVFFVLALFLAGYLIICLIDVLTEKYTAKVRVNNVPKILFAEKKDNGKLMAIVIVISIAVHNFPEGMVIGVTSVDALSVGYILMIALHNIPEGMAMSLPMMQEGKKPLKAIGICALTGLPTVLGGGISYFLGGVGSVVIALCLALAGGAMCYVVFNELLPCSYLESKNRTAFSVLGGIMMGMVIIFSL